MCYLGGGFRLFEKLENLHLSSRQAREELAGRIGMGDKFPLEHFAIRNVFENPEAVHRYAALVLNHRRGNACDNDLLVARFEPNLGLVRRRGLLDKLEGNGPDALEVIGVHEGRKCRTDDLA